MSSLFVWQVYEQDEWGTVAVGINGHLTPLVTRKEQVARDYMGSYAQMHAIGTQLPVRLARFDYAVTLETFGEVLGETG